MDNEQIIGTIVTSVIGSIVASIIAIIKTTNTNKAEVEKSNMKLESLKEEMNQLNLKVNDTRNEFVTRKEFEMFIKSIDKIDRNIERINDKLDSLTK